MYRENTPSAKIVNPFDGRAEHGFAGDIKSAVDACVIKMVRNTQSVEPGIFSKVYAEARLRLRFDEARAAEAGLYSAVYEGVVNALAQRYMYDVAKLNSSELEKVLETTLRMPGFAGIENRRRGLDSLSRLLKGLIAHERANDLFSGAWQATLLDQPSRENQPVKPAQELTRDDVAREFEAFKFRKMLIEAENTAIERYQNLLDSFDGDIRVTEKISLERHDIQALIIDIKVRIAERIADPAERRKQLDGLDQDLKKIIEQIPDDFEHKGKKFEIQEIYLLRRLIHSVDSGHLMAVSHGTPREDLNPDRGSVDIVFTTAGNKFLFQLKTFKRSVSAQSRMSQWENLDRARAKLKNTPTRLSVLEAESVERAYESAARQGADSSVSLNDKFTALNPLVSEITPKNRKSILGLLGLSEENLSKERERIEKAEELLRAQHEEIARKKAEEQERENQAMAKAEEIRLANLEAEQAKIKAAEEARLAQLVQAQTERQEAERAKLQAQEARQAKRKAEREEQEKEARELEAKERERQAREQKREQAKARAEAKKAGWPPPGMVGLISTGLLVKLGMLTDNDLSQPAKFIEAKKKFLQVFGKPKRGAKGNGEADLVPNEAFAQVFPDRECHKNPDAETLERFVRAIKK